MTGTKLTLEVLADELAVCRLASDAHVPDWAWSEGFTSVTRTEDELSVVCAAEPVPVDIKHTPGWRALKVRGPLDFSLVGILAGLSNILADAGIPIFAISTYDTDYLLVRREQLDAAAEALKAAGYEVV
jgi:hypothetical protein